jgi:hypothetical protein
MNTTHYTSTKMAQMRKTDNCKCYQGWGIAESHTFLMEISHYGKQFCKLTTPYYATYQFYSVSNRNENLHLQTTHT